MKYYSKWQDALIDFIQQYGENYKNSYNLIEEFEQELCRNVNGVYFIYTGEKK